MSYKYNIYVRNHMCYRAEIAGKPLFIYLSTCNHGIIFAGWPLMLCKHASMTNFLIIHIVSVTNRERGLSNHFHIWCDCSYCCCVLTEMVLLYHYSYHRERSKRISRRCHHRRWPISEHLTPYFHHFEMLYSKNL